MPTIRGISSASTSPLGSGIDGPIARRQMAFAPAELDGMLDGATVGGRRLVKNSFVVVDTPADAVPDGPTPWFLSPLFVCWLFLAVAVGVTVYGRMHHRPMKGFDAMWFAVLGLTGCLLTFLIFVSVHEATSPNYLYYMAQPPLSACACAIVGALSAKKILRIYFRSLRCRARSHARAVVVDTAVGEPRILPPHHCYGRTLLCEGYSPHCQK